MKDKGLLTGWIECELETKTPIFIPNTTNNDIFHFRTKNNEQVQSYEFYSYEDLSEENNPDRTPSKKPIIPGSEIRGMIRTSFEAVTNSCLSTINEGQILYRRVSIPAEPGRIERKDDNAWQIQPCNKYKLNIRRFQQEINGFVEGEPISFTANQKLYITKINNQGTGIKGYFHQGEKMDRKNNESVFVPNLEKTAFPISSDALKNYLENLKLYSDKNVNLHYKDKEHTGYNKITAKKENDLDGALIYYKEYKIQSNNKTFRKLYLCPAQIGREIFYMTLSKVIGTYTPCNLMKELCQACLLFGFTSSEDQLASRIRFCDAFPIKDITKEDYFTQGIIDELASPKLTAAEFYLKKSSAKDNSEVHLWNYDYAGGWKKENKKYTNEFITMPNYKAMIKGRKFYWHQKNKKINLKGKESETITIRNIGIRPLKQNIKFSFKVYFNHIREEELKKLIWVLEIGNYQNNAHKIGMGKSLGLGSVRINVKEIKTRRIKIKNKTINYKIKNDLNVLNEVRTSEHPNEFLGCESNVLNAFIRMTNFEDSPQNVSYPINIGEEFHYKWFVVNKNFLPGSTGMRPIINQSLPENVNNPNLYKYLRR